MHIPHCWKSHAMAHILNKIAPETRIREFAITIWAATQENLSSGVCEQHRLRPACASAQTDQHLCYSLFGKYHM